jgi:hypothetical protein
VIELCNSPAKVAKNPFPTKCFEEIFEVSKNIFLLVIEAISMKTLLFIADKISARKLQ